MTDLQEDRHYRSIGLHLLRSTCPLIATQGDHAGIGGTGVLVEFGGDYFLVTAAHVARHLETLAIPVSPNGGDITTIGHAEILNSAAYDISVARLTNPETIARLRSNWEPLPLSNVGLDEARGDGPYVVVGYPAEKTRFDGSTVRSTAFMYVANRDNGPAELALESEPIDPAVDFWLRHNNEGRGLGTSSRIAMPDLRGISGCSVWRVQKHAIWTPDHGKVRLAGIETGFIPGRWVRCRRWAAVEPMIRRLQKWSATSGIVKPNPTSATDTDHRPS